MVFKASEFGLTDFKDFVFVNEKIQIIHFITVKVVKGDCFIGATIFAEMSDRMDKVNLYVNFTNQFCVKFIEKARIFY